LSVSLIYNQGLPGQQTIGLVAASGSRDGAGFQQTVLDQDSATALGNGSAGSTFTGTFRPDATAFSTLDVLTGLSPNANWTLRIVDTAGDYVGTLNNWSVQITTNPTLSFLNVSGIPGNITDLNVRLNLTYAEVQHLKMELVSPAGTRVELFLRNDLSGANLANTYFDDAGALVSTGSAPYTGRFRPSGNLSAFNTEAANGIWRLEVSDEDGTSLNGLIVEWEPVTQTVDGSPVDIAGYEVIITNDSYVAEHGFNQPIFDVHVPPDRTRDRKSVV